MAEKNEPFRNVGMRSCTSPAWVDNPPRPRPVALAHTRLAALITGRADPVGHLELDQLLQHQPDGVPDQIDTDTSTERIQQLAQGRLR
jgi:hypothetical protein